MTSIAIASTKAGKALFRRVEGFFLKPASPRPLGALRIGVAAVLLVQAFLLRHDLFNFFASDGLVQGELAEYLGQPGTPRLSWLFTTLAPYGVTETACISWTARIYLVALGCLLLGLGTRVAAVVAFCLHWTFMSSGYCSAYGLERYAHVFLFYLLWVPSAEAFSLDRALGRKTGAPSSQARLGLRVMQLHLALAYFAAGVEKALNGRWWNGEQIWSTLSLPEYQQLDLSFLHGWPLLLMAAGWGTLIIETFFCIFIWPRRTRRLWLLLTVGLHVGIAIFLGLHLFGAIMCVLVLSLFGVSAEPKSCGQEP